MPVSLQSQIGGKQQADQALAESISSDIRVAIPGVIQSFDPDAVTCVVLPAVKGEETDSDGRRVDEVIAIQKSTLPNSGQPDRGNSKVPSIG